jgi:phenylpropionate dioxygenase-like ring-hydroxylating dioxygenase large terminal subunit
MKKSNDRFSDLVLKDKVHCSLYTDPSIFKDEMNRIFGGTWTFLAHESEIPENNDFVRKKLGLRPVIVTRDSGGTIHALLNRCTHRGATICRVDEGSARRFTCPYHNWSFSNNGDLIGVPMSQGYGPDFEKSRLSLGRVRVDSYRGFIFGTLNPDIVPLAQHLGRVTELLDDWLDRWPGGVVQLRRGAHRLLCAGNWKLIYDNAADGYHPAFSHASLLRMRRDRYGAGVDMQWTIGNVDEGGQTVADIGNGGTFIDQRHEIERYWDQSAPMPGEDVLAEVIRQKLGKRAEDALDVVMGSGMNLNIFPNLLIIGNQIQVIEPIAHNKTEIKWYASAIVADDIPEEVNILRMRLQEDFPSFGEPDDLANFEECQVGMEIEEVPWIQIGRHLETGQEYIGNKGFLTGPVTDELPLRAFWQEWLKRMNETKQWIAE